MRKDKIQMIKEIALECNKNIMFLEDEFDHALIGTATGFGGEVVISYDASKCLEILIKNYKMSELEAYEKFRMTILSVQKTDNRPIFVNDFRKVKLNKVKEDVNSFIENLKNMPPS